MPGLIGLAILLIFAGLILTKAATILKIPSVVVTLLLMLFGFYFVYALLAFFGMAPATYVVYR